MNAGAVIRVNRGTEDKPEFLFVHFGYDLMLVDKIYEADRYPSAKEAQAAITRLLNSGKDRPSGRPALYKEWEPEVVELVVKGT